MNFLQEWRTKVGERIKRIAEKPKAFVRDYSGSLLYGAVAGMALEPVAQALASANPVGASIALFQLAGQVGANLIASLLQQRMDEDQAAHTIAAEIEQSDELKQAVDEILAKLEVLPQLQATVRDDDRRWLLPLLSQAFENVGSRISIQIGDQGVVSIHGPAIQHTGQGTIIYGTNAPIYVFPSSAPIIPPASLGDVKSRYLDYVRSDPTADQIYFRSKIPSFSEETRNLRHDFPKQPESSTAQRNGGCCGATKIVSNKKIESCF